MGIAQTEVFGPVLSVMKFQHDEEAWQLANDTPYGLAAGVWTQDQRRMFAAAKHLRAGMIWTNCYRTVSYTDERRRRYYLWLCRPARKDD